MVNEIPDINPKGSFCVKETCGHLGISKGSLRKYRLEGKIKPLNPEKPKRLKYSGSAIRKLWLIENPVSIR